MVIDTCWKIKADGERAVTVTVTVSLIVAVTLIVTVYAAVAVIVIVIVVVVVAGKCPGIGDASVGKRYVESPHHHLRRPRS